MNRIRKSYFLMFLALILGRGTAFAADFSAVCPTGQTLYYNIIDAINHYVAITYPGASSSPWNGYAKPTGNITLPSTVTYNGVTYSVKAIGNRAFDECTGLTGSLTIPNSVTSIGGAAFFGCGGFTGSLTIPNSVTTIGANAFRECAGFTGSVTIPNSVTIIGESAFEDCTGFTAVYYTGSISQWCNISFDGYQSNPLYIAHNLYIDNVLVTNLVIPETVTEIKPYTFYSATCLTSLTIGGSVISIGAAAFKDCSGITAVYYAGSISQWCNISFESTLSNPLYIAHNFYVDNVLVTHLVIPETITEIKPYAFAGATCLTSLTIGNSVTMIGKMAFYDCSGLTGSLTIPNSVTSIGYWAFRNCSGFTGSLTIPNSVTLIEEGAFSYCSGFTGSLTLPYSLTTISEDAFEYCHFTGTLNIPNSVTSIGACAFRYCNFTGLSIPSSVTSISDAAFSFCMKLASIIVLPVTPPTLGNLVFYAMPTNIPVYVLCESLSAYQSASGWSDFTNMQCYEYEPLTYSINPDGVSVTVTGHFNGTAATGELVIPSTKTIDGVTYTVTAIGDNAFNGCGGLTGLLFIPNTVTTIGDYAFYDCHGFTGSLTIPNSVTTIGGQAFRYCTGFIGSLTLGTSVTTIGISAFNGCSGFTGSLTIPNSVTSVNTYAFYQCSGFTGSLTIGQSVTTIGNYAFRDCSGFTGSLTIGRSVTTIGNYAFCNCNGFTSMTVYPDAPPSLGSNAFKDVPKTIPVYVPCESLETYQGASGWNAFTNMQCLDPLTYSINADAVSVTVTGHYKGIDATGELIIPETKTIDGVSYAVTAIGLAAFDGCTGLTGSLTIPNSVTTIGQWAFYGCTGFTGSLTLGNSVTSIDFSAFNGCSGFTGSLIIPNSVTSIGQAAFSKCTGFTGLLVIPNGVTTIGYAAFYNCTGFTSLTISDAVTTIKKNAFKYCVNLTSMTVFPVTPPTLAEDVFYDVPTDIPVYVPCESLEDYQAASGWNAFTNIQCPPELTVFDGTVTNSSIPANIIYFDEFTRSQFIIPANVLAGMTGATLYSMTFYTPHTNVPYTTVSDADVYLKEVDYTSISAYESKTSATTVYSGRFSFVSAGSGGEMTISFDTPYTYHGGNLLVGVENTETNGWKEIGYYGQTVEGASISGLSSTGTIPAEQQNFIPKTTFSYIPGPSSAVTQALALSAGWNWVSLNVEITMDDLKSAVVAANPGAAPVIKSKGNGQTSYNGAVWVGALKTLDLSQMYEIKVANACTINLEGVRTNPADHPATIKNGVNWIAYPLDEEMTVSAAFEGFPVSGDNVKSKDGGQATWNGVMWLGALKNLVPGTGYLYISKATDDKTLTF